MDGSMVDGSMVNGGMVDGSMMRRGMVCRLIMRFAGVLDIGDIAGVSIINVVVHCLEATIRKLDMVLALSGIAIAALASAKVEAVLVGDTVLIGVVGSSGLIVGLVVASSVVRGRGVVDRGMVDGGVMDGGSMVDRGVVHGSVVDGSMVHWGMVDGGMVHWSMVHGSMVRWPMVGNGRGGKGSNEDEVLK